MPESASPNNPPSSNSRPLQTTTTIAYQGPLPPPSILRQYDEAVPGSAKTIMDAFQSQHQHRLEMESIHVKTVSRDIILGRVFSFLIALIVLGMAFYCFVTNKLAVGIMTFLTEAIGVTVFYLRESKGPANTSKTND